jgi:hypothetical protein
MKLAYEEFTAVGIEAIESACNAKRLELMRLADGDLRNLLDQNDLNHITIEKARDELGPAFALTLPPALKLEALRTPYRHNPRVTMAYYGTLDPPTIRGFIPAIEQRLVSGDWKDLSPTRWVMYHELIHACGDIDKDGLLRHNWAGADVIRELVRNHPGSVERASLASPRSSARRPACW